MDKMGLCELPGVTHRTDPAECKRSSELLRFCFSGIIDCLKNHLVEQLFFLEAVVQSAQEHGRT